MKSSSYIFWISIFCLPLAINAQELKLQVIPRYSYGFTIPSQVEVTQGSLFTTTQYKSSYSGVLIDTDGVEKNVTQRSDGFGLDIMAKYANKSSGTAWGLMAGVYRQKYLFFSEHPSFSFKGHTLGSSVNFYRTTGLSLGLRREFLTQKNNLWFAQMNTALSLSLQKKGSKVSEWIDYKANSKSTYIENGTGTVSTTLTVNPRSLTIGPEIGLINRGQWPLEISVSYQQSIGLPLTTEQESYYERNKLIGTEVSSIKQNAIVFHLRLPLTVFKSNNTPRVRKPKPIKQPKVVTKPTPPPVVKDTTNDLANYKKNQPVKLKKVTFALSESKLSPQSYPELNKLVQLMKERPNLEIRLEGHTDKIGSASDNMQLSKERVKAVKDYLVKNGIKASRIETLGYGDTRTICSPPCQENRRVEFVVTKE